MNQGAVQGDDNNGKKAGRYMLKLSGEAFSGGTGLGVDPNVVHAIAREIAAVVRDGGDHVRVHADLATAEHLPTEFEHNPAERTTRVYLCHAISSQLKGQRVDLPPG